MQAAAAQPRSLLALALENAVEGCVHETWAAARAAFQARYAADPEIRRLAAGLAADESRHADLAAALHRWFLGELGEEAAALVETARISAWRRLIADEGGMPAESRALLGLPDRATCRFLAHYLATGLSAAADAA